MKTICLTFAILAGLSIVGCGESDPPQTTYDPYAAYQEMQAWNRYLENETARINQTYDTLDRISRANGFLTID